MESYRTGDELMKHRDAIEEALRRTEKKLFSLRRKIVLYDVTNSHFEGECKANPKAVRGRDKQKPSDPDSRQTAIYSVFGINPDGIISPKQHIAEPSIL